MTIQQPVVPTVQLPSLTGLETFEQAAKARSSVFGSVHSLRHFYRRHRDDLFRRGAVLEIAGRMFVAPGKFDQAVLELSSAPRKSQPRAA
jgi:hypothetical protein